MVASFVSLCSDFCSELKEKYANYQYNKHIDNIDKILDKIKNNNSSICSTCEQENKDKYTIAVTSLIYDKIHISSPSNIGKKFHELIVNTGTKGESYIQPFMLYLTKYNIIIAARPDLMGIKDNNIIIREITTTYFENIKNNSDMIRNRLNNKELQVLIYSFIAKKILENDVNYRIELYFYDKDKLSLCQGNSSEYIKKFVDKNKSLFFKILRDSIEIDCYKILYNRNIIESLRSYNRNDIELLRLVIKGRFTPEKESYIEKVIEEKIEEKILKNF